VGDKRVVNRFVVAKVTGGELSGWHKDGRGIFGWNICKMTRGGVVRDESFADTTMKAGKLSSNTI